MVVEKSRQAARATDDYVHDHPWQAAAVGTGIGVVIGLLLNRK
ncbi:glycine zipper domain-containing protein [Pandoraea vervacti]